MRWFEIIGETDNTSKVKNFALDVLSTLKSQGQNSITVYHLKDILQHNPDISGINITDDFIINLVKNFPIVKEIKQNPDTDENTLTIYLKIPVSHSQTVDQEEKNKEKIKKAAVKQIKQKQKK